MENKKIIIIAMYVFIQVGFNACGKCDNKFLGIFNYDIADIQYLYANADSTIVFSDSSSFLHSLFFQLDLETTKIAKNKPVGGFGNVAYAWSFPVCFSYGDYNLTNKIDSIIITSNHEFNGISVNNNLNNYFTFEILNIKAPVGKFNESVFFKAEEFVENLNQTTKIYDGVNIISETERIIKFNLYADTIFQRDATQQFNLSIYFEDNTVISQKTNTFIWQ